MAGKKRDDDLIMDLLDAAAKRYGIKALAPAIKGADATHSKAESTLRNELNGQPGYKLGLLTAIDIMAITGDLAALDVVEHSFGRVAFNRPAAGPIAPAPLLKLLSEVSKEFGEHVQAMGEALADGTVDRKEAARCRKELTDLIDACLQLDAYLANKLEN